MQGHIVKFAVDTLMLGLLHNEYWHADKDFAD